MKNTVGRSLDVWVCISNETAVADLADPFLYGGGDW